MIPRKPSFVSFVINTFITTMYLFLRYRPKSKKPGNRNKVSNSDVSQGGKLGGATGRGVSPSQQPTASVVSARKCPVYLVVWRVSGLKEGVFENSCMHDCTHTTTVA